MREPKIPPNSLLKFYFRGPSGLNAMEVHINGDKRDIEEGVTLERLLASLGIKSEGIAVDVNREVIPKRLYGDTLIRQGDSIEIIRMVGGG